MKLTAASLAVAAPLALHVIARHALAGPNGEPAIGTLQRLAAVVAAHAKQQRSTARTMQKFDR